MQQHKNEGLKGANNCYYLNKINRINNILLILLLLSIKLIIQILYQFLYGGLSVWNKGQIAALDSTLSTSAGERALCLYNDNL